MVIKSVIMFEGEFRGMRTAYSSNSIFIVILSNPGDEYDVEAVGGAIFPDGFGSIEPPGPSFGFGPLVLNTKEESGRIHLKSLKERRDSEGKDVSMGQIKEALEEYMDAFFKVDAVKNVIVQINFPDFYELIESGGGYKTLHLCEFEPEEDYGDEDA